MTPELRAVLEGWLGSDNPVERAHAAWRLTRPVVPPDSVPIPLAESLPLLRLVNLCLYRSRDAACGCSGHRCALRVGRGAWGVGRDESDSTLHASRPTPHDSIVSHLDCLDCVRTYGQA
jgi:hypothetical protein